MPTVTSSSIRLPTCRGAPSIGLTRRISNPDGSFAGVVLIALNLEYFHPLFTGLSLGQHGSMSLIRDDGALVAPFGAAFITVSVMPGAQLRRRMCAESELVLLARTDGLTGLGNRRSFAEGLDREWRRARSAMKKPTA